MSLCGGGAHVEMGFQVTETSSLALVLDRQPFGIRMHAS